MESQLTVTTAAATLQSEQARLKLGTLTPNTRDGYASDWTRFCAWCEEAGYASLPALPETASLYLTYVLTVEGPLFTRLDPGGKQRRMDRNRVRKVLQAALARIGIDPTGYGSHSLRAGLVTEAAESGCSEMVIAAQTGHKSMEVLHRYFRRVELFRNNAAAKIGL